MTVDATYYITTPIYYVNDVPHIGHAYTSLACDYMARFKRLCGYRVKFLTGTDEHGLKVQKSAEAKGIDPQTFTDEVSQNFRELSQVLNFSNDDFIRTTEPRHIKAAQHLWNLLFEKGFIYLSSYSGWYSIRDEAYYQESELKLNDKGQKIAPSGAPCEWIEEPSYFFKLTALQDRLLEFYDDNPDFILPKSRRNEVLSFVRTGLQDLSVSRTSFNWGVPVPGDAGHIMYVWMDALTNYMTAVGFGDKSKDKMFEEFWPAELHMVGKDILRFHAIYWPAFLMAADIAPPKRVFAHGWWTIEGEKMSKSLGNVISPKQLVETYGLDQTRFFLLREVPFGNDGDFSHASMIARTNSELANDFGNLIQRSLSMVYKNCDQKLPNNNGYTDADNQLLDKTYGLIDELIPIMDRQEFHKSFDLIWSVIGDANKYVDEQAPWGLKKTDPERMHTVLYVVAELVRVVSILLQPIMPDSAKKILDHLHVPQKERSFSYLTSDYALKSGTEIEQPMPIFPRYVKPVVGEEVA